MIAAQDRRSSREQGAMATTLEGPGILAAHLILLLGCQFVRHPEHLSDLLRRLALDHVGDGLAGEVQQALDLEVTRGRGERVERAQVDVHELPVEAL